MANCNTPDEYPTAFASLKAIVHEQIDTADDALEDWEDLVPDEVKELRSGISAKQLEEIEGGY